MKNQSKKHIILFPMKIGKEIILFTFILLILASPIFNSDHEIDETNSIQKDLSLYNNPQVNAVHGIIAIDGNNGDIDWDSFPVITGSGIFGDPYCIENLEIDATGNNYGISISNSKASVQIINCNITDASGAGILLSNCSNIEVINCTFISDPTGIIVTASSLNITLSSNYIECAYGISITMSNNLFLYNNTLTNGESGIHIFNSHNHSIIGNNISSQGGFQIDFSNNSIYSENIVNDASTGFSLSDSNHNTLNNNNISHTTNRGISLNNCVNNTLIENEINDTGTNGIFLIFSNNNTLIENTICYSGDYGIYGSNSDYNALYGNNASYHSDYGIYLLNSNNYTIIGNIANENQYGIYMVGAENNSIFLNNFFDNTVEESYCNDVLVNFWDNGTYGNFWGDYEEKYPASTNTLTIWDTPYQINADNIDNFPLVTIGAYNSDLTITHPSDRSFSVGNGGNLEWTIYDIDTLNPTFTLYQNGQINIVGMWTSGVINSINLDSLTSGIYNYTLVASDGMGKSVFDTVKISVMNERGLFAYDPIFIDGDDEANDWDMFLHKNGSGTFEDPYIIENFEIDAGGIGSGIYIRDSSVYVEIYNCNISNGGITQFVDAGIRFQNCTNVKVSECILENNGLFAILVQENSIKITLIENIVNNNDHGIWIEESENIALIDNQVLNIENWALTIYNSINATLIRNIVNNSGYGIRLQESSNCLILNNTGNFNADHGFIANYLLNSTIIGNTAINNSGSGFETYENENCSFSENTAINNTDYGFAMWNTYNTVIKNNEAYTNSRDGIVLPHSSNCTISGNILKNNGRDGFLGHNLSKSFIIGNILSENSDNGIRIQYSTNNSIIGNDITFSPIGIFIFETSNCSVNGNTVGYNFENGIILNDSTSDIYVFENWMIKNQEEHILDLGLNNNIYSNIFINFLNVSFSCSKTQYYDTEYIQFTDISTGGIISLSYLWNFGDSTTSTIQNPEHRFSIPGNYSIFLTITDGDGDFSTYSFNITIIEDLFPTIVFSISTPNYEGDVTSFTSNLAGGNLPLTYLWEFGDGNTSSLENPTHIFNTAGTYVVKLTVTDENGDTASYTLEITINETPIEPSNFSTVAIISVGGLIFVGAGVGVYMKKKQKFQNP